ncbi:hypothetical protein IQ266_16735 [filamentous cyanobacterium LEGE 11480]|uniref:Uncharacterized protein n=1 Tax=Romeriopsis navalis LEGE 11480 TaxID=2777977 RepID=A0A928Z4U5_9CYAN|nr:hypothetical protein [Romeriopsis navalis]MBE9031382.1 hypothetical protein [Romeriopsis navalis LEGE 11480]
MKNLIAALSLTIGFSAGLSMIAPQVFAQTISGVTPRIGAQDATQHAVISGVFSGDKAVDPQRVKIFIDGQDVTAQSSVTEGLFSYRSLQPLSLGRHTVRVEYANIDGEWQVANWSFYVRPTTASLEITSVTHNAVQPLNNDSPLLVTIKGTPNAAASVLLAEPGMSSRSLSASEISPGVYVATMPMQSQLGQAAVLGRLKRRNDQVFGAAAQPIRIKSLQPATMRPNDGMPRVTAMPSKEEISSVPSTNLLQPTFSRYADGDRVTTKGFTLAGKTEPSARIDIQIVSSTPLVGGLVNLGSTKLLDRAIIADTSGHFEVRVPAPAIVTSGTKYKIRAVARQGNVLSPTTQLILEQQ